MLVTQWCLTFVTPRTGTCQALLSMGFSRQEYWSGLPFPSPGDLPDPGIEPRSPTLQADSLSCEPSGQLAQPLIRTQHVKVTNRGHPPRGQGGAEQAVKTFLCSNLWFSELQASEIGRASLPRNRGGKESPALTPSWTPQPSSTF